MGKAELLSEFNEQLSLCDKYQSFIEKAQTYAERFNPAVVAKVVTDNTAKLAEVAEQIVPMAEELNGVLGTLTEERQSIVGGGTEGKLALEELQLKEMIGEITSEEFSEASGQLQEDIDSVDSRVAEINEKITGISDALAAWNSVAEKHGFSTVDYRSGDVGEVSLEEDLALVEFDEVDMSDQSGVHHTSTSIQEDVSAVFERGNDEPLEMADAEDESQGLSFDDEELELGAEDDGLELELPESDEPGGDLDADRRAVLICHENTPDEKVYPLTDEIMSLGRGRNNFVQVKNDSKVSRHHCKVMFRDSAYYIEDNGSANGTLVNGEHITERRLYGGEEIIIGETFFRFRIGD